MVGCFHAYTIVVAVVVTVHSESVLWTFIPSLSSMITVADGELDTIGGSVTQLAIDSNDTVKVWSHSTMSSSVILNVEQAVTGLALGVNVI